MKKIKKVIHHLKDDMKMFDKEKHDDKELMMSLTRKKHMDRVKAISKEMTHAHMLGKVAKKKKRIKRDIIANEMHEFKEGNLHSGSKSGPVVSNPKQAIAISLSVARRKMKKKAKKDPNGY